MIYTLVGKKINDGLYQGRQYHYVSLYVTADFDCPPSVVCEGVSTEVVKVKRDCDSVYRRVSVGKKYRIYYDKFKNVEEIIEDQDKK